MHAPFLGRSVLSGKSLLMLILLLGHALLPFQDCLAVLVKFQLCDHAVRCVDGDLDLLAYGG